MTNKDFIKRGYTRYPPNAFHGDFVTDMFQKPFKDKNGKRKYFLTWEKWDFSSYEKNADPVKYEASTQVTHKDNQQVIDITFLNGWEINDAEKFMKKLFNTGWFNLYDQEETEDADTMTRSFVEREDGSLWWE